MFDPHLANFVSRTSLGRCSPHDSAETLFPSPCTPRAAHPHFEPKPKSVSPMFSHQRLRKESHIGPPLFVELRSYFDQDAYDPNQVGYLFPIGRSEADNRPPPHLPHPHGTHPKWSLDINGRTCLPYIYHARKKPFPQALELTPHSPKSLFPATLGL